MGGKNAPPEVIASWPKPNYVNPETKGDGLIIASVVLIILAGVVVCLRLYTRIFVVRQLGIDDYLILISTLLTCGIVAVIWDKEANLANRHIWDIPRDRFVTLNLTTWVASLLALLVFGCTKLSILFLYRRILTRTSGRIFHWANTIALVIVFAYTVAFTLAQIFQCTPINSFWLRYSLNPRYTKPYHCINEGSSHTAYAVINVTFDFIITLLPIFFLHRVSLPRIQKWALCGIFGLGFFVCCAGAIRTHYLFKVYYYTYDVSWPAHTAWGWTLAEIIIGIVCASAPALKPFFIKYLGGTAESFWSFSIWSRRRQYRVRRSIENTHEDSFGLNERSSDKSMDNRVLVKTETSVV